MNELHDLKKKVRDQLTEYSHQELSMQNIDIIGKLVDIMKDINEISKDDGTYNGSYNNSYAGRSRDSMGRYMNYEMRDPYYNRMTPNY